MRVGTRASDRVASRNILRPAVAWVVDNNAARGPMNPNKIRRTKTIGFASQFINVCVTWSPPLSCGTLGDTALVLCLATNHRGDGSEVDPVVGTQSKCHPCISLELDTHGVRPHPCPLDLAGQRQ